MAITAVSTSVVTGPTTSGSSHNLGIPTGGSAGEVIILGQAANSDNRYASITGWTLVSENTAGTIEGRIGWNTRITDGTESSPVTGTLNTGTAQLASVAQRFSGIDTADPHNSDNYTSGTIDPASSTITIPASTITGLATGSGVLVIITCDASRSVSSTAGELTNLGSSASSFVNAVMLYDADAGGSSNPEYVITMSGSRAYNWMLVELKAAGAAPVDPDVYITGGGVALTLPGPVVASGAGTSVYIVTGTGALTLPSPTLAGVGDNGDTTVIIGDDPIWPPRYNDARIMYLITASGITPTGAIQDDIKLALATLLGVTANVHKYTIDDLWMRYKVANGL